MKKFYYFSEKLQTALNCTIDYPLTVLMAGSGCGKTTAVEEYLLKGPAASYRRLFYTCLGETKSAAWKCICGLLKQIDGCTGKYLASYETPSDENCGEIAIHMRELVCEEPTVLIIDNFQLAGFESPGKMLHALSLHQSSCLHILVLTQPIGDLWRKDTFFNSRILRIGPEALRLTLEDILSYFRQEKVHVTKEQCEEVFKMTEGHMAAVRLQINSVSSTGRTAASSDISDLMETAFWSHLKAWEQETMLVLSVLKSFTLEQALIMTDGKVNRESMKKLLAEHEFIRYDRQYYFYIFHHLLQTHLLNKFMQLCKKEKKEIWKRAALACLQEEDCIQAAFFYGKLKNYPAIMALPFTSDDRVELVRLENGELVEKLIEELQKTFLAEYPELLLSLTLELYVQGKIMLHIRYLNYLSDVMKMRGHFEAGRFRRLQGEFALMESFFLFNDIGAMRQKHEAAFRLLQGPTKLYSLNTAWTFGAPSVVFMFWRETGKLKEESEELRLGMPTYHMLSQGNGMGAWKAMAGEIELLAGRRKSALRLYGAALKDAEGLKQDSICFCAELGLARLALMRGDAEAFGQMQEAILRRAYQGVEASCVVTSEVCMAVLNLLLEQYDEIPSWFCRMEIIRDRTLVFARPYVHIIYGHLRILRLKQRCITVQEAETAVLALIEECEEMNMLYPKVYYLIYLAIVKDSAGMVKEAREALKAAWQTASGDEVYLPFAEFHSRLRQIWAGLYLNSADKTRLETIQELAERLQSGKRRIKRQRLAGILLTEREEEIMFLLKQRMTIKEIAAHLNISPSTVSNTAQKIYNKLKIHSRRELDSFK